MLIRNLIMLLETRKNNKYKKVLNKILSDELKYVDFDCEVDEICTNFTKHQAKSFIAFLISNQCFALSDNKLIWINALVTDNLELSLEEGKILYTIVESLIDLYNLKINKKILPVIKNNCVIWKKDLVIDELIFYLDWYKDWTNVGNLQQFFEVRRVNKGV